MKLYKLDFISYLNFENIKKITSPLPYPTKELHLNGHSESKSLVEPHHLAFTLTFLKHRTIYIYEIS